MNSAFKSAICLGLGAGLMYMFDPRSGRRRRAIFRDKAAHYARKGACAADIVSRDLFNRIEGFRHEGVSLDSLKRLDALQPNWSPATRFVAASGAAALLLYGAQKKGLAGQMLSAAAGGLFLEALTPDNARASSRHARHSCSSHAASGAADRNKSGSASGPVSRSGSGQRDESAIVPAESGARTIRETTGISDVPAGQPAVPAQDFNPGDIVQGARERKGFTTESTESTENSRV